VTGPQARRPWLLLGLAALLLLFVADRWALAATHAHLLFHADRAEYAYYGAFAYDLDRSTLSLLTEADGRHRLLTRSAAVGDMGLHGTTTIAGLLVHFALAELGADVSTWTLKRLAIAVSTATLALWLLLLARAWRAPGPVLVFGLLFVFAPLPLVKLNLLLWGTHEVVLLLHALALVGVAALLARPPRPRRAAVEAAVFGAAAALLFALNFSLLLFLAFAGAWLAVRAGRSADRRRLAVGLGVAATGLAAFALAWAALTSIGELHDLGYRAWPLANPRVGEVTGGWYGPLAWARGVLPVAPGLVPGLVCAVWLLVEARRTEARGAAGHPLTLLLAGYLLFGWVMVASLPMGWLVGDGPPVFQHRFAAHLYPVALAVVAAWCASRRRRGAGVAALALLLVVGLAGQLRATDSASVEVLARWDGAALYCELRGEDCRDIPRERFRMGGASPWFLRGLALLTRFQKLEQLDWIDRGRLEETPIEAQVASWIEETWQPGTVPPARREFLRGIGYALRLLYPPDDVQQLEPIWRALGEEAVEVKRGYDLDPASLEAGYM